MSIATSTSKGLMDPNYIKMFPMDKSIKGSNLKQLFKLCSLKAPFSGFNALILVRTLYSSGDSSLVMINACLGGGTEYVNAYSLFQSKTARCFLKKKSYSDGFDLYIELPPNHCMDVLYVANKSNPLILNQSTDSGLVDIPLS